MNVTIEQRLQKILEIGNKIVAMLDSNSSELDEIELLYSRRGEAIRDLDNLTLLYDLNWERKKEIQSLFEKLKKIEKKLNEKLVCLAEVKQQALGNLDNHKKAKKSYSRRAAGPLGGNHKIIDLKQR